MEHPVKIALIWQVTGLPEILALEWLSIGTFFAANQHIKMHPPDPSVNTPRVPRFPPINPEKGCSSAIFAVDAKWYNVFDNHKD
jgi:hypothetical protein